MSRQPSGLRTPEACTYISPGHAFFAYPGKTFPCENRTLKVVRGLASLLRVHFRAPCKGYGGDIVWRDVLPCSRAFGRRNAAWLPEDTAMISYKRILVPV